MGRYLELADEALREYREERTRHGGGVIDGHPVQRIIWETERAVVFQDPEGRVWRRVHSWGQTWPITK